MVIVLLATISLLASLVVILVYLLGFRLGGQSWFSEIHRVRVEAATAEREMHDLTRAAFVAMAEQAEHRRQDRGE